MNSVEPKPTPFTKLCAIAAFPFCMQGVILAKMTSPFTNHLYPFATCSYLRVSGQAIVPVTSSTALIGTNETISDDELTKFKRTIKKGILDGMKPNAQMAELLTYNEVIEGDWAEAFDAIDRVEALTAGEIKQTANKYLIKKNRTIGEIIPEK